MSSNLYDEKGYQIKLVLSKTYNPKKSGESEDDRELGVLVTYLGAVEPVYEADYAYKNDIYVISRFDLPSGSIWNPNAVTGFFYEPDQGGAWTSLVSACNLKEPGIRKSGLKIEYTVPEQLAGQDCTLQIWADQELLGEERLDKPGRYSKSYDVSQVGKEAVDYIEKAHRILMILLKEVDRICRKYHLHYYVICGSLLGTVRNKDLIPWDDDVDVAMPREDFNKFVKCVKKEWGDRGDFQFVDYNRMGKNVFLDFMSRVVYMKEDISVGVYRKMHGKGRADIENHMPVDIYVMDNAFENDKMHKLQVNMITFLYGLAIGHRAYVNYDEYARRGKKVQTIVKILSKIGRCIPLSWILFVYEWVRKWNKNSNSSAVYESNGFIMCIPWKFRREWFGEGVRLPLYDMEVSVPSDYDAFLKKHYWDYMMLPPMEAREPTHSVKSSGIF